MGDAAATNSSSGPSTSLKALSLTEGQTTNLKAISPTGGQTTLRSEVIMRRYGNQGLQWWGEVQKRYGEIQRRYHTLTHVELMLELVHSFRSQLSDPEALELATIFHDIVYDPWAQDNEESSAACFQTFSADIELNPDLTEKVNAMIIATKNHVTDGHKAGCSGSDDIHYFIDIDMQVLGWPDEEYTKYAKQIREEYKHIPDEQFKKSRIEVLKKLFQSPHLYATKEFREQYEAQSRANIIAEIKRLERN